MFNRSNLQKHNGHPYNILDSEILKLREKIYLSQEEEIPAIGISNILQLSQSVISHALNSLKAFEFMESY